MTRVYAGTIGPRLRDVLAQFPIAGSGRSRALRELRIRFRKNGAVHQLADYDRKTAAFVADCGQEYDGDAYNEVSLLDPVDCMLCIADADDPG